MLVDGAGVRRRGWVAAAALALLVCALALPALARAEEFVVDSVGEQVDAAPGAGGCATAGGKCTLRAAIEEANVPGESDTVAFDEVVFGGPGATIVLADSLPAIVEPLYIRGTRECASGASRPCVGLSGPVDDAALTVQGTSEVEIEWLAVTDAEVGLAVAGSTLVKVFGSWFGVRLDGSAGPNQTGVHYGPGSDAARVGRPDEGNVFANNTAVGLDLFGASGARILGNRFGVKPDGSTPAANGEDIEVSSDASGEVEAVGNEIGTRLSAEAAASPQCDKGCNVIAGAAASGIDLQGDGGDEAPALGTTIAGNYFGLAADGQGAAANAGAGIRVGAAAQTVIGGAKAGDANRFSGGAAAVEAGPGAPDLVVRGNRIGTDATGAAAAAPATGLAIDSAGLESAAVEAILAGNEIRMSGGVGILQQGFGAWIVGNAISGAASGIKVTGGVGTGGNLIEGNSVVQSELDAILLESELNEVYANRVSAAGGAGIAVRGALPYGIGENVIGGDSAAAENEISASANAAILIQNASATMTTVGRNRGAANSGLFIDLLALAPGSEPGPNGGIAPPAIATASPAGAAGSGEPGALVRVFGKKLALAGEVEGFLGAATVGQDGAWSLAFASPLPPGTPIAASQTSAAGGTSELALAGVADPPAGGGAAGGGGDSGGDRTPPRTAILKAPKAKSRARTARFRFDSDEPGTSFQCRLDRQRFRACSSPQSYAGLGAGKHLFAVRAVDAAGNADPSPATRAFTILPTR